MNRSLVGITMVLALITAACGGGADIEVSDIWGRPSPSVATIGAFYMVITNNTDAVDHLISASSDACGVTELHESMMNDDVMSMSPVGAAGIEVPAGGRATLQVGGLHVMCVDKQADFAAGEIFDLSLEFENAGTIVVEAEIREDL